KLLSSGANVLLKASYSDDDGNRYMSQTGLSIFSANFVVPEHFEEYVATVPEHFETMKVFVPGYEGYTHVRFYGVETDVVQTWFIKRSVLEEVDGTYRLVQTDELVPVSRWGFTLLGLAFTGPPVEGLQSDALEVSTCFSPVLGLEMEVERAEAEAKLKELKAEFMLTDIEPIWEDKGILDERNASELVGVSPEELRAGELPTIYDVEPFGSAWIPGERLVLNSTEFELYKQRMEELMRYNEDIGYDFRSYVNATRTTANSTQTGYAVFVYHPLSVRGSGPLTSIQVRNYAALEMCYKLQVSRYGLGAYYPTGAPVWEARSEAFAVMGLNDNVLLASSLASEGFTYVARLFNGSSLIAEVVFDLHSEPSPFWTGFWDAMREKLPGIMITSSIIVLTSVLTGGGTAATYAGLAISVAATLYHLIAGAYVDIEEIRQGVNIASYLNSLADFYGNLSYRLSGYTPAPISIAPYTQPMEKSHEAFEPNGPLAEVFWEESKAYRQAASKVMFDTGLNLVLDVGISDFETALNPNAVEYDRGFACGRIVGTILSLVSFVLATRIATELRPKMEGFSSNMWSALSSLKAYLTPAVYDLTETLVNGRRTIRWLVENPEEALDLAKLSMLGVLEKLRGRTLEIWSSVKEKVKGIVNEAESRASDEDCYKGLEDIKTKLKVEGELSDKLTELAERTDQEQTVDLFCELDEAKLSVEERVKALDELSTIAQKSREAGEGLMEWLEELETGRLREVVYSGLMDKMGELEESVLKDVGEAWRLNKDTDSFNGLLKGLSVAPDYPVQGKGFYDLLHMCVESSDPDKVGFLGRGYGWIAEIRTMELEPDQRPAKIVENAFPFIRDVLNTLDGINLRQVSEILDDLLESRGKRGAYDEMLRLKRHLFIDIGLGGEEPKVWLLSECMEKWYEASRLSDAIVSHQMLDKRGHYRARSPVEVNYLDAGNNKVIPIIAAEDEEGGFGITIPRDAAEYLGLKDEGFITFFKNLPQGTREIVPVKVDGENKIALTEWFEKTFAKTPEYAKYFDEDGKIKWTALKNDYMLLEIKASKEGDKIDRMFAFTEHEQKIIRVRVGEIAEKDDIVECELKLVNAHDYLQYKYRISEKVAQEVVKRMYNVMLYEAREELDAALGSYDPKKRNDLIGAWGEWEVFQKVCEYREIFGEIIGCQVGYPEGNPETIIDFVTDKYIIEVKNWNWDIQSEADKLENVNRLLDQMEKYKTAQDLKYSNKRVVILFYREIPEDVIGGTAKGLTSELLRIFQDRSKFEIINGIGEISKLG
ncbi:MAG: hypothetical protein QXF26_02085, partial [Candidatus Bathyarchaeia archaeon]